MAQPKPKQPTRVPEKKIPDNTVVENKSWFPSGNAAAVIPYPVIWLALVALLVYIRTCWFGFTELDDSIFIREFHAYNEDIHNLITSFQRGLFDATKDPYYRPIFHDSMILNYQFAKEEIGGYHFINVLIHVTCVVLLFKVFIKLRLKQLTAFLLALLFAVHPVISQAVAWIPGRNDTILAIFTFSFFIFVIDYVENGKTSDLLWSVLFLLLAFFTKETAVFVAPAAFVILTLGLQHKWLEKRNLVLYGTWVGCFVVWFVARSLATVQNSEFTNIGKLTGDFVQRLPLIIQYMGKIFLPVNLSVFPIQQDTVYYFGFIAIVILAGLLWFSKNVNWRMVGLGGAIFMLFLLPALLIPNNLNEQTFEHRLYLPIVGILLILGETVVFKKLTDRNVLLTMFGVCGIFTVINLAHQQNFESPVAFWSQAVKTSPHSAYANMMLGAREDNLQESYNLFHTAYRLNPKEKYLNYYYGVMLQKKDSILASEPYLLAEKNASGYYECDFYLARVAMMKGDTLGSMNYLKTYLKKDPGNPQANNNLLLMYFTTGRVKEAKALAADMQLNGLTVPPQILERLNAIH